MKGIKYSKLLTDEAIEIIDDHEIHLIIMMPKMDGLRATMKIREDNNIPVIIRKKY